MKILIADSQQLVREGTVCLLRNMMPGVVVNGVGTAADAIDQYAQCRPDVLITDLLFPDFSGLELSRRVCQRYRKARIVFLCTLDDISLVKQALSVGAQGFVSKCCAPAELLAAIRTVAAGEAYLEHGVATQLAVAQLGLTDKRLAEMTQREVEVLIHLARGESHESVARRLSISTKTVANHVSTLKGKLEISSPLELLHFAVDSGLVQYGLSGRGYTEHPNP